LAFRAARMVVDKGIHSQGWTFYKAVDFFESNTGFAHAVSQFNIMRYASWPG